MTENILYSAPQLLCSLIIFSAGGYVLWRNYRSKLNQSYFFLCLATGTWLLFYGINFLHIGKTPNQEISTLFFKLGYCGIAFISIFFLDYILIFLKHKYRNIISTINYIYGLFLVVLITKTNLITDGLYHYSWGYYPKAGSLHPLFITIFLLQSTIGNILTLNAYKRTPHNTQKSEQLKFLAIGFLIFSTACWDFLGNYGFELYPFGYIPATIFILITYYAILKHNLLDITIVINKGLVYSILLSTITVIYLLFVILVERISQNFFRYTSVVTSSLAAILIATIFIPLRNKIQQLVDQVFFKKSPIELASENELLRAEVVKTEKLKAIATLASGMAHEVRNPLTALKTFSEYLPDRINDKEFLLKFSRLVGKEVNRIDDLVTELLEFARPSPVQLKPTNLNKLIQDTLDLLNNKFIDSNIKVLTQLDPKCSQAIMIDPNKMRQVFLNLFLNAIDAIKKAGELKVLALHHNDKIYIEVTDSGCGIPKENIPHIFDPFFSTKDTGTGLGLPITYGIIKEHGGEIKVESKVDQGTKFVIILPA